MRLSYCFVFIFSVVACSTPSNKEKGKEIKEIMRSQEIKKVSEVDILNKAREVGNELAASSQTALSEKLATSIKENGIPGSIKFCRTVALPLTDSIGMANQVSIKRTSIKLRNPENRPNSLEGQLLEAYQYSFEHQQEMREEVQAVDGTNSVLFTKPILLKNPVCLNCHGEIGNNLLDENDKLLKSLYPADSATGYKLNDFRGMWSITIDKKVLVNLL
ncbi:MAG: DUF3365 domain-containing protein [Cyclobacteriaceae bacterium]